MDGQKVMNTCLVLDKQEKEDGAVGEIRRSNSRDDQLFFPSSGKNLTFFYFKAAISDAPSGPNLSALPFLLHKKRLRQAFTAHLIMKNSHAGVDLFLQ